MKRNGTLCLAAVVCACLTLTSTAEAHTGLVLSAFGKAPGHRRCGQSREMGQRRLRFRPS